MFDVFKSQHPELCTWQTRTLNAICGFAILCAAAGIVFSISRLNNVELVSRRIDAIAITPSILLPGQKFTAHIDLTINKLCPYEVQWSLVNMETGVRGPIYVDPIREPATPDHPGKLGKIHVDHERTTPPDILPGNYGYLTEVFDECDQPNVISSVVRARFMAKGITIR